MHVHAVENRRMRTTVEITDPQRARLLEIAARRGEKGFSKLVQEALDLYLERDAARLEVMRGALSALGRLDDGAADRLEASSRRLRESWR
jgi:hypothetical protein